MTAEDIFNKYGIRKTIFREAILTALMERHEGLTYGELTNRIGWKNNKATILRALNSFQKMGLVNKIIFSGSKLRYYYTEGRSSCYVYFICQSCNRSYIFNAEIPVMQLPGNKQIKKIEFIVSGTCSKCNE